MNTVGTLIQSYYGLIQGCGKDVFTLTAPLNHNGDYVLIYPEGGVDQNTKTSKNETVIVRVEIVTRGQNEANQDECESTDTTIYDLIMPSASGNGLSASGLSINNVFRENYQYFIEQTTEGIIYKKTSRYSQRVHQN
jgi:hypothetical protein